MTPFTYGEFYDLPRQIIVKHNNALYVLLSVFDDEKDDYSSNFAVYLVPLSSGHRLHVPSKLFLECADEIGAKLIGHIPVREIAFDETLRKELDASILDRYFPDPGPRVTY